MIERSNDTLPANRAFVIQFRPADLEGGTRFEGRIEHLASGRAEYFSSHEELCKLLDQLLPRTELISLKKTADDAR